MRARDPDRNRAMADVDQEIRDMLTEVLTRITGLCAIHGVPARDVEIRATIEHTDAIPAGFPREFRARYQLNPPPA